MEEPGRLQSMGSLSRTRLSDFTFTFHFHALEKEMATHSSVLAWRIPGTGEPGGLLSMGLLRVGTQLKRLRASQVELAVKQTNTCLQCSRFKRPGFDLWVRKIPWRRAWQSIPASSPGESYGQRSLAGYSSLGGKESDGTEAI